MSNTKTAQQFVAKDGSGLSDERAARYGRRIEKLKASDGVIDPAMLVKDARDPDSPLHDAFEWDNEKAAQKWRVHKARKIIASIEVELEKDCDAGTPQRVRAFYHVETGKERSYVDIESVKTNDSYRDQIVKDALRRLERWKDKYEQYKELAPIASAIERVTNDVDIEHAA